MSDEDKIHLVGFDDERRVKPVAQLSTALSARSATMRFGKSAANSMMWRSRANAADLGDRTWTLPTSLLRFADPALENRFVVVLMMSSWRTRVGLGTCLSIIMMISLPGLYELSAGLLIGSTVLWAVAVLGLVILRFQQWYASRRHERPLVGEDLFAAHAERLPYLGKHAEYMTIICFYGGELAYTMSNVVTALACPKDVVGRTVCQDGKGYDTNGIIVFLLFCTLAPVRVAWIAVMALLNLAVLVLSFVWVALDAQVFTVKLYAASVLFATEMAACVALAYFREVEQRKTFLLRLEQEHTIKQAGLVKRLAEEAATRHFPDHIVRSLSQTGSFEALGECIAVGFALANVGQWIAHRGPRDMVRAVADFVDGCERGMKPLLVAPASGRHGRQTRADVVTFVQVPMLGDVVLFTFFCHHADAELAAVADRIVRTSMAAVERVEESCRRLCAETTTNAMLTPPPLSSKPCAVGAVELHALCSVTRGGAHVWYEAATSSLVATGAAVTECRHALRQLSSVLHDQPRLHVSDAYAASLSNTSPGLLTPAISELMMPVTSSKECSFIRDYHQGPLMSPRQVTLQTPIGLQTPSDHAGIDDGRERTSMSLNAPPFAAEADDTSLEDEFRMEGWISRFAVESTEAAFSAHRQSTFDVGSVVASAMSMFALGVAMFVVCVLYKQLEWAVRSPLPYVFACCAVAVVLFAVCQHKTMQRRVTLLELCYWAFCMCCMASSVMSPQFSSMFGQSVFPWCFIAATVSLQRPLWYGPLTMWALELCICLVVLLGVFLPTRTVTAYSVIVAARTVVAAVFVALVLRLLIERQLRAHFKLSMILLRTHEMLKAESANLVRFLDEFIPTRVAEAILRRRVRDRGQLSWLHMDHRSALVTHIEDQAFALVQWRCKKGGPGGSVAASLRVKSVIGAVVSAMQAVRGQVCIVKMDGNTMQLAADVAGGGDGGEDAVGVACGKMVDAVLRVRRALADTCEVRGLVGVCPMVGALLGNYAPSFEWFAPELHAALRVLRMSDNEDEDGSGPVFWGQVVCTERARYHVASTGLLCSFSGAHDAPPPVSWSLADSESVPVKVCGAVPTRLCTIVSVHAK